MALPIMRVLSASLVSGFAFLTLGCSAASNEDVASGSQSLDELVLDASFTAPGPTSLICFVGSPNTWGQEFVPAQDNVAAASFRLRNHGPGISATIDVSILDAAFSELGATSVPITTTSDGEIVEVYAEFDPAIAVTAGDTYILKGVLPPSELDGGLAWLDGRDNSYTDGAAVSWCPDDDPTILADNDMDFATYALVETPAPTIEEILAGVDPDPAAGQMTGANQSANQGRLQAFQQKIDEAEALFAAGDDAGGCAELASARSKLSGSHAWFAGETAAALLEALDALAAANGC
jgi:hypothetical protein